VHLDRDETGHVVQHPGSPPGAQGDDPAFRAPHQLPWRLHRHPQPPLVALRRDHMDTVQAQQHVAARAGVGFGRAGGEPVALCIVEVLVERLPGRYRS